MTKPLPVHTVLTHLVTRAMKDSPFFAVPLPEDSEPVEPDGVYEYPPEEIFVDSACTVCGGDGFVGERRCLLCDSQNETVQSME